jgi:mono/diheme cytochrome c family protein
MKRTLVNLLIDLAAAVLFLGMLATGYLIRFPLPPGTNKALSLWGLSRHQWGGIHFWISVALLSVLLVHLALHWQWVVTVIRRQLTQGTSPQRSPLLSGILTALAVGGVFLLFAWSAHRFVRDLDEPCCDEGQTKAIATPAITTPEPRPPPVTPAKIAFWEEVYPIFEASCLSCHGPKRARGGFRVDRRDDFFRTDLGKPWVIPGNSAESPLFAIVSGVRTDIAAPDRHRLSEKELAVVKAWIDAGAAWPEPVGKR